MPLDFYVLKAESTGEEHTELESFVLQEALTVHNIWPVHFRKGIKRHQEAFGHSKEERGERLKPRVACWPDKAAACLYLSFPGQQKQHSSRIQIGSSNGACSIWRLRHSLHLAQRCAAQLAG